MAAFSYPKSIPPVAVAVLIVICFLGSFFAQTPTPSPSPLASPTVSPSPSPTSTPSPTPLPGAQNFHQWGSITVFNGLPSDSVRAIAQTPDGVMWFGTDNGLSRFDGRRIQNFSLGDADTNRILALQILENGELWVGTRAGAYVYSGGGFEPIENTLSFAITSIVSRGDDIWRPGTELDVVLGTESGLVLVVRKQANGLLVSTPLFTDPITSTDGRPVIVTGLISTDHGAILASTSGRGVFLVDDGITEGESMRPAQTPFVNAIVRDSNSNIWLGIDAVRGASGIIESEPDGSARRISAPTSKVLSLEADGGEVWAGTERYGLFHFADSKLKKNYTFANTSGGLRSDTIYTLFTDREGVLWIGTNRGVSRFDRNGALQETVSDIPNSNFIRTVHLAPVEGEFVYAGSNRGLFLQSSDDKWNEVAAFRNKTIYAIRDRGTSSLNIGTSDGLYNLNGAKVLDGDVRSLDGFTDREYAAVFGRGVFDITGDKAQLAFANEGITAISKGRDRLWVGTVDNGLMSFNGRSAKSEMPPDLLKSGTIWKINEPGNDGNVWIAGQHGVFLIRNGNAEQISEVEDVRDVWVLPGEFWAATTTRGLIHGRYTERFGWLTSSIGFEQGLPSEKAFSILPVEGGFVIGTNRGVVTYVPSEIEPKLIPVRLLSQRTHDVSELAGKIDLEYPQNSLLIEVAGQSSRTFPEEFQYAFVLTNAKGEEVARQISNDPQFAPKELKPGEYVIEAIAFNRDLLASEPLFIRFSIAKAPFPWTATALGVLLVLALVGLLWAFIEHRRMSQRNRELAAARFDLANEAERERRRIARDLHDQTLADLRSLMMRSDKGTLTGPEFRKEVEAVSTEIRRICEDLSPSVLENVGLVASLEFLLGRTIENHLFSADESVEERIRLPINVQLQIYRIAQEVLANIQRHSDANLVEMKVEASDDGELLLQIIDDGKPFHPDGGSKPGRGIANIRSRASLINAVLDWKNGPSGKNVFELRVADKSE